MSKNNLTPEERASFREYAKSNLNEAWADFTLRLLDELEGLLQKGSTSPDGPSSLSSCISSPTSPYNPPPTSKTPLTLTIPPGLLEIKEEIEEWDKHRRQKRSKMTQVGWDRLFLKLQNWGVSRARAAIIHSIECGYLGVFEPREESGARPLKPNLPDSSEVQKYVR